MDKIRWPISLILSLCMLVGVSACNSSMPPIVVDPSHGSLFADGWGTSLAWWANEVGGWPPDAQKKIITMLFAPPPEGLGLTIARYNIGAGTTADPQITASSHVSCPALRLGAQMPTFEPQEGVWNPMADSNQVQVLQAAKRAGANIFEAFVNSPPAWMTVSGCTSGNPNADHSNLNMDDISHYVAYLQQVIAQFAAQGISFRTLEPFNEANLNDGGFVWSPQGCGTRCQEAANFTPGLEDSVLNALCSALQGTTTTVSAPDENSIDTTLRTYQQYKPLPQCLTQINTHSYKGSQRQELQTMALQQHKQLWMSEYTTNDPLILAKQIATDLNGMHPAAWIYWQAVESFEQAGSFGLLHVPYCSSPNSDGTIESLNQSFQEGSHSLCQQMSNPTPTSKVGGACNAQVAYCVAPTEQYSVMANYSMFVRPGDYLLDSPDPAHVLEAFNPTMHTLTLVATNDQGNSQPLTFDLSHFTQVTGPVQVYTTSQDKQVYTTSQDKQVYQEDKSSPPELSNQQLSTKLDANSVTTFVIKGASIGPPTVAATPTHAAGLVNLTFSGALVGPMTVTQLLRCGHSLESDYMIQVNGTISGTQYNFGLDINPYRGPGTYTSSSVASSGISVAGDLEAPTGIGTPGDSSKAWFAIPLKVTINSDEKSGTLDATLINLSGSSPAHVSGNWMC